MKNQTVSVKTAEERIRQRAQAMGMVNAAPGAMTGFTEASTAETRIRQRAQAMGTVSTGAGTGKGALPLSPAGNTPEARIRQRAQAMGTAGAGAGAQIGAPLPETKRRDQRQAGSSAYNQYLLEQAAAAAASKAAGPARTRADVSNDIDALRLERQRLNGESMNMGILDPNDPQYDAKMQRDLAISLRVNEIAKEIEALENEDEALRKLEPGYGQNIFQRLWGGIKGGALNAAATNTDAARTGVETFVAGNAGDSYARYAQYAEWARQEYEKEVRKHGAGSERARWLQQEREKALEMGGQKLDDFDHSADNETVRRMANTADKLAAQSQAATEYAKSGASKASKLAVDLASQGVQMVPDAAANAVAPGAGLALMGVRSFGAGTQKARQAGANLAQQMGYGAASASVEVLTEKMFDGLAGIYGKGFADGVVEGIVDKLAKGRLGPQAVKLISGMSEEAIEEMVAGIVDPMLENLYDPQPFFTRYKDPDTYAEIGYGMLIGGLMGGIGTGGKLLVNNVTNARANRANITSPGVENETAAPGAETTAINDDPAQHTAAEQRVIEAYKAAADPELTGFIDRVRGLQNQDYKNGVRLTIRTQTENAARKAAELTGVDTSGYSNIINGSSVQHIDNRHGANGTADHSMANIEDFSRIGFVLDNFTDARVIPISELDAETRKLTKAWRSSDNTPAPMVQFSMPVNGTYYVVEAVPSSKAQVMAVVSAYMSGGNKKDSTLNQVLNLPESQGTPTSSLTPEALHELLGADNGSIPQTDGKSKRQNQGPNLRQPTLEEYVRQMYGDNETAKGIDMDAWRERMRKFYGEEATAEAETAGKPGLLRDSYVENALDSGTVARLDSVAKALGLNVRFVDRVAGGMANSSIRGNQVLIEKGNPNPVNFLLGHEITHRMQELAPAQYQRFKELVANEADTRLDARETLENYRQKGLDLTDEGALDEAVADYAGRMMEDGQLLDNFIRRYSGERTLLEKLRDAFRALIEKLHGGERRQAQMAVDRLNRALDTAAANAQNNTAVQEDGGARYSLKNEAQKSITQAYQKSVDDVMSGSYGKTESILMGYTPDIYQSLGMPSLPFVIGPGHVYSIAKTEAEAKAEGRYRNNTNYHGMGVQAVKDLYSKTFDPVMVIAAKDDPKDRSKTRSKHSVVAIVDVGSADKSLLLPIEITAERTVNGQQMDVNVLSSAYHKNASELVREAIAQENIGQIGVYYAKKKAADLLVDRVQFPKRLTEATASNGIVHRLDENVNLKIMDQTQSLQFKRWFGDWQNDPEHASKVIDADGEPLVMYHGTREENGDFTVFDYSKAVKKGGLGLKALGKGNYFTSKQLDGSERYGSRVISAYLDIRRPFEYTGGTSLAAQVQRETGIATEGMNYDELQDAMRKHGYDGVIERGKDGRISIAVTFDSNQIKSTTDNIGTFDRSDPDIRHSLKGTDHTRAGIERRRNGETELGRKLREAMAQAGAQRELALDRANLQSQYEAALTQARASGDFTLANALYKELVRIQKLKRGDDR